MDQRLVALTAGALAGLASRPNGGHGIMPKSPEAIGREAALLGRAALEALEDIETEPVPTKPARPKGR